MSFNGYKIVQLPFVILYHQHLRSHHHPPPSLITITTFLLPSQSHATIPNPFPIPTSALTSTPALSQIQPPSISPILPPYLPTLSHFISLPPPLSHSILPPPSIAYFNSSPLYLSHPIPSPNQFRSVLS
ncbi:hypothetical protein ACH5RR_029591 [Cinchona calisaya]|uniref:Uncharacterized protein n=1 Tax=Cinchona calisaya TaxID=153742 RepID=A0ABD2YVX9_9GENT